MSDLGAVSKTLEQDVLGEVRRQGIVVWLDKDNLYSGFVDRLIQRRSTDEASFPFPVVAFRGSGEEMEEFVRSLQP